MLMVTTTRKRNSLQRSVFVHSLIKHAIYTSLCIQLVPYCVHAQAPLLADLTDEFESPEPARNRLFTMSTGRTMPTGRFSIASFEIFLLQIGYAPLDFFQLNLSYLTPVSRGSQTYWSVGTKFQVLKPSGVFRGVAIGADLGFFEQVSYIAPASSYSSSIPPLVNVNMAVSVGGEIAKMHVSVGQLQWSADYGKVQVPSYIQFGFDASLSRPSATTGLKLIGELTMTQRVGTLNAAFMVIGLRGYSTHFTGDFGWPFGFGESGSFVPGLLPFFSFNFYL